mgnify:FL=1
MNVISGVGLGLRSPHIEHILRHQPNVPWFELLTDNWLDASGIDGFLLDQIAEQYPLTLHGVCMNIAGTQALNFEYLTQVKNLAQRCKTSWISDHLAFSAVNGKQLHDLAPIPYTDEALQHVINRVNCIQSFLEQKLCIENISAYVAYADISMSEAEFLNALARETGCSILLDVNNLYVNQKNLGQNAKQFIETINKKYVSEMHLGGYTDKGEFLLDAHNNPVSDPVWALYELALQKMKDVPTLIEWDNDLPEFSTLLQEQQKATALMSEYSENRIFA